MKFAALLLGVLVSMPIPASAESSRVRAADGRAAAVLRDGLTRSETLRGLVEAIEQSDVIVYLETRWDLRSGLAGSLGWVTATKSARYVRISLSAELPADAMVAILGHELQHAVEIARERSIVSSHAMALYYERHGLDLASHWSGHDTLAARAAGDEVRRELGQQKFQGAAKDSQHSAVTVRS